MKSPGGVRENSFTAGKEDETKDAALRQPNPSRETRVPYVFQVLSPSFCWLLAGHERTSAGAGTSGRLFEVLPLHPVLPAPAARFFLLVRSAFQSVAASDDSARVRSRAEYSSRATRLQLFFACACARDRTCPEC